MLETIKLIMTQFNDETLAISILLFILAFGVLGLLWIYNRKKYHQLAHQIPAFVIKNYLDTIIQNSNALKSSLFRGGGLDVGEGIPSVRPVQQLGGGNVELSSELLNQKNAEIASLQGKMFEKDQAIRDLEAKLMALQKNAGKGGGEVNSAELESVKEQLTRAQQKTEADQQQIQSLTKERDDLKTRLQEYEIIEDDLANLKKLQQENEELKKKLATMGSATAAPVAAPAATPSSPAPEVSAAMEGVPGLNEGQEEKSAEDLLSEFEKMLE